MERIDGPGSSAPAKVSASSEAAAAPAGAAGSLQPSAADQAAADEARVRFRRGEMPALTPDDRIRPLLDRGERLLALRHHALLDRREPSPGGRLTTGVAWGLYLTSRRLVLAGRPTLSVELETIEDAVLSGERVLLVLRDGHGVALESEQPRLLLAEIASARAAVRANRSTRGG
jgi:hypothetical protein